MTQEDKELLLKDLCGRLPYGVIVNYKGLVRPLFSVSPTQHFQITLDNALDGEHNGLVYVSLDFDNADELKPYLRPMSSMTEEELKELKEETGLIYDYENGLDLAEFQNNHKCLDFYLSEVPSYVVVLVFDWFNAHHFDYRGLIEKGLAIAITEENNPYEH